MKNKHPDYFYFILGRYSVIILLSLFNLKVIYAVFTPLTVYPLYLLIKLFSNSALLVSPDTIFFSDAYIVIIPACIGGAAYYLLLILNLATPMENKTRVKSIFFVLIIFLVLNIFRIVVLSTMFVEGFKYFDAAHSLLWNFGSTVMLVIIWFVNIKLFKIKNAPVFTDFKKLHSYLKKK